ncbi:MAG TPA: hypothetical protein VHV54_28190 [Candidatus Binatia bacterium]|nr:hypothetical protein [Candidatus Binatia bacterium]
MTNQMIHHGRPRGCYLQSSGPGTVPFEELAAPAIDVFPRKQLQVVVDLGVFEQRK